MQTTEPVCHDTGPFSMNSMVCVHAYMQVILQESITKKILIYGILNLF